MAIAEGHAYVNSTMSHGGFIFVLNTKHKLSFGTHDLGPMCADPKHLHCQKSIPFFPFSSQTYIRASVFGLPKDASSCLRLTLQIN